jgi:hypothetical protein
MGKCDRAIHYGRLLPAKTAKNRYKKKEEALKFDSGRKNGDI